MSPGALEHANEPAGDAAQQASQHELWLTAETVWDEATYGAGNGELEWRGSELAGQRSRPAFGISFPLLLTAARCSTFPRHSQLAPISNCPPGRPAWSSNSSSSRRRRRRSLQSRRMCRRCTCARTTPPPARSSTWPISSACATRARSTGARAARCAACPRSSNSSRSSRQHHAAVAAAAGARLSA